MKANYLYQSKYGKKEITHFYGCHYIGRNASSPKVLNIKPSEIYGSKFYFCQFCSPVSVNYRRNRKLIETIAQKHKQKLSLEHGIMKISNGYSEWMVVPGDSPNSMTLYHKNTIDRIDSASIIEGYHLQIASIHSIAKIQLYIVDHDKYRKSANANKRAEQKHIQELSVAASDTYLKKEGKRKPQQKYFKHKKHQVIKADTSDWEAFQALFKPNAAR